MKKMDKIFLLTQNIKQENLNTLIQTLTNLGVKRANTPENALIVRITDKMDALDIKNSVTTRTFWVFIGTDNPEIIPFLKKEKGRGPHSFKGLPRPAEYLRNNGCNFVRFENFDANSIAFTVQQELERNDVLDMSESTLKIPLDIFVDMQERLIATVHGSGKYPQRIEISSENVSDKVWDSFNKKNRTNWAKDSGIWISMSKFAKMDSEERKFFAKTQRHHSWHEI